MVAPNTMRSETRSAMLRRGVARAGLALAASVLMSSCTTQTIPSSDTIETANTAESNPVLWPEVNTPPLDPVTEARVEQLLGVLTLEQKIGQVIQGDTDSLTAEDVKRYRLGSVLSGGNSAPGDLPYADAKAWLDALDAFYNASVDPEGVEVAIPVLIGIDAVHGHNNLTGATIFPHNIGLGAANDPDLIERIARATARELAVSGHDWTFAPTLATPRDDRWGRTYEGYSENPELVASYANRIVYGIQGRPGEDMAARPDAMVASAKHFLGDGGTLEGIDQGDALISEAELRDIHGAGYVTALEAGAKTVMASFSAWNGKRMHGHEGLLTDVLKARMNFNGFVVGDWNGHALIPGCTATDCPQSFNAGVDMYMAPNSWKGVWESTKAHVESGVIPMERLDEAVRRILRVKLTSGLLDRGAPSTRPFAGDESQLGSLEHRAIAREAVRKSLVLVKNNGQTLPLDPSIHVHVIGDGADDISKASGGWTLSWQGGGYPNDAFPNGASIYDGIVDAVEAAGGTVTFDPSGEKKTEADVVIAVYGEDPYAEFQGDRPNVDFTPNAFDPTLLAQHRAHGAQVVSVFLSGRPLFTNPEINASDAFVAAWLPGSEGGGVADLLFQTDEAFDFTGRLSFSWPKTAAQAKLNVGDADYDPLFPLGYGLGYASRIELAPLSEETGLNGTAPPRGVFYQGGRPISPWRTMLDGQLISTLPFDNGLARLTAFDHLAQEDGLRVDFDGASGPVGLISLDAQDYRREATGAMELAFNARSLKDADQVEVGMACTGGAGGPQDCFAAFPIDVAAEWRDVRIPLNCFVEDGVDMSQLVGAFVLLGQPGQSVAVSDIRLEQDSNTTEGCGDS